MQNGLSPQHCNTQLNSLRSNRNTAQNLVNIEYLLSIITNAGTLKVVWLSL